MRSGGGFPGIDLHVGIWSALTDYGIESTHCAGTSAGAIVAALDSAGIEPDTIASILRKVNTSELKDRKAAWKIRIPWLSSFLKTAPIQKLLEDLLDSDFSKLEKPLSIFATDETDAKSKELTSGDLLQSLMASIAIPGVLPSIKIGNRELSDGGTTNNLPLPKNWREYDEVYLLIAARPLDFENRGKSVVSRLLYAADLQAEDQINDVLREVENNMAESSTPRVFVIRPAVAQRGGMLEFNHALIEEAHRQTIEQLAKQNAVAQPEEHPEADLPAEVVPSVPPASSGFWRELNSNFLWNNAKGTTHVFLSQKISEVERSHIIRKTAEEGYRAANIYLLNSGDYQGRSVSPFKGEFFGEISNEIIRTWHERIRAAIDDGVWPAFWFFSDDSKPIAEAFKSAAGIGQIKKFIRRMVEDFDQYALAYVLGLEVNEWCKDSGAIAEIGAFLKSLTVKPCGIHQTTGRWDLVKQPWCDFGVIQCGFGSRNNTAPISTVSQMVKKARKETGKIIICGEYSRYGDSDEAKRAGDAALDAGAAAVFNGCHKK